MILAVGNDDQFSRFCTEAGVPELVTDARFATNKARVHNRELLIPKLDMVFLTRNRDEWLNCLEAIGVPCGPINDIGQVYSDPQVRARGLRLSLKHPKAGKVPGVASPIKFSRTPIQEQLAPPTLGQHTEEVLAEILGLTEAEIGTLKASNAI
jgi:crotonobetainyl-CoA:carnitine CoA-transferase CaiB-like acyl-CoA transferase